MALSPEGLARFAGIYSQEFSETLTQDEVEYKARMLLNLYLAIYRSPLEVAKQQLSDEEVPYDKDKLEVP